MASIELEELRDRLDRFLEVDRYRDACPNGLQVEGTRPVSRVAFGVTANLELFERARAWGADAVIVHHGLFWKSQEDLRIERSMRSRLAVLIESGMSLLAYHLPLDGHLEVGNNAILARTIGATGIEAAFDWGGASVGVVGRFERPLPVDEAIGRIARATERDPLVVAAGPQSIERIGVVSGAAAGLVEEAARRGLDLFVTGEPREAATHVAREEGVHLVCAGHHATERFGVRALAERLESEHGLETTFVDVSNPV